MNPTTGDATGQRIYTLANAVYIRIFTPLGSWWAAPEIGSRLHELLHEKDLSRVGRLAKQYAEDALKQLLEDGRATAITVTVSQPKNGWLVLDIEVLDATGNLQVFRHPVRVI